MFTQVHVIGAGLAGLAAAVQLQRSGSRVVLHEAAAQAGGRCRSYFDRTLNAVIDNGNHLVLSGNGATLDYLQTIGTVSELTGPAFPEFAFVDLATKQRWLLRLSSGRVPAWLFDSAARVPDTKFADYLSLIPLFFARNGRTMAQTMRCDGVLWERLLRPLFLAALNVEPRYGTAELAAAIARETFGAGGRACRPLIAHTGLSAVFIDPALRLLQQGGAEIRLSSRVRELGFTRQGDRVDMLRMADGESITLAPDVALVLAVPPNVAQQLVPQLQAPDAFCAIINAHFAIEPPPGLASLTGIVNGLADWLFAFDGRLSVTISGADHLLDRPREELLQKIWRDVAQVTGLPAEPMPLGRLVVEKRATFAAVPAQEVKRPAARTRWSNLALAGDWTATGLPATIEGAIRSGRQAAEVLCRIMDREK